MDEEEAKRRLTELLNEIDGIKNKIERGEDLEDQLERIRSVKNDLEVYEKDPVFSKKQSIIKARKIMLNAWEGDLKEKIQQLAAEQQPQVPVQPAQPAAPEQPQQPSEGQPSALEEAEKTEKEFKEIKKELKEKGILPQETQQPPSQKKSLRRRASDFLKGMIHGGPEEIRTRRSRLMKIHVKSNLIIAGILIVIAFIVGGMGFFFGAVAALLFAIYILLPSESELMRSLYGFSSVKDALETAKMLYMYGDEKEAERILNQFGLSIPQAWRDEKTEEEEKRQKKSKKQGGKEEKTKEEEEGEETEEEKNLKEEPDVPFE